MLRNNNGNSVVDDLPVFSLPLDVEALRSTTFEANISTPLLSINESPTTGSNSNICTKVATENPETHITSQAAQQLATGVLQWYSPPITKAKGQLKELIQKQNKIYIDLSAEKFKLDNAEMAQLNEMMNNVKVYREKLLKIKKQMQNIYQRTKVLKKRAINIQTCKEKELQRKLHKQQQEESLIGKQPPQ